MFSLCINAVCFSCFLCDSLTHTHTQVHSVLVFTLASVCVFYLFLYSLQLFSYRHGCYLGRLAFYLSFFLNTPFLSYSLPPSFSFLTLFFFSVSVSSLVSVFHSPQPRPLSLSFCCTLSHSLSFFRSLIPRCPSLPLFFPSHSFFISLYLSSLSLSLIPPSSLFLLSLASSITPFHSLTHSFFLSVSPSLCLTALKAVIINYMVIRASRFPFSFLAPSLSAPSPPPPHTHTHNLFSFYFPCLCLSVCCSLPLSLVYGCFS